jgi:hypothetical protein
MAVLESNPTLMEITITTLAVEAALAISAVTAVGLVALAEVVEALLLLVQQARAALVETLGKAVALHLHQAQITPYLIWVLAG